MLYTVAGALEALAAATSMREVIDVVTRTCRRLLPADGVTFILRDGELCHYSGEDCILPLWKGRYFSLNDCVSGWCMNSRSVAVIPDITCDPRVPQDAYADTFVKSLAMVPVGDGLPVAAIGAYWGRPWTAAPQQVELLRLMANAASLALDRLEMQRSRDEARACDIQQRLLVSELSHRVKDTLAVVQTLALQTLRSTDSLSVFHEKFLGRLQAVAGAHALLLREDWTAVRLGDLVNAILEPFVRGKPVVCEGPDIHLMPKAHITLAMVLHELATNAVAHGALATDGGALTVAWQRAGDGTGHVTIRWEESLCKADACCERRGFGLSLVQRLVESDLGGQWSRNCTAPSPIFTITFPTHGNVAEPGSGSGR